MNQHKIEVCLTTEMYPYFKNQDAVVIVTDILRATSSICMAFSNGIHRIIPVASPEEAVLLKNQGYIVASEKDGIKRPFADFGNSPQHFTREAIGGRDLVYCTTNGTRTIHAAYGSSKVVLIGAFANLTAVAERAMKYDTDVLILCSGWKGKFNIEDTLFAGAVAEIILSKSADYQTHCDSTTAAMELWRIAKKDLSEYIKKVAHFDRLTQNGHADCIPYCIAKDTTDCVPMFNGEYLTLV